MRPFNTAGSLIPPFFPSFSRLFSFFFYCTQHAHTFPVLLVTVHGVAICYLRSYGDEERAMERARVRRIILFQIQKY